MEPRFAHDCTNCSYVGQLGRYDLYTCPQPITMGSGTYRYPTLVARHGDKRSEYLSGATLHLPDLGIMLTLDKATGNAWKGAAR